MKSVGLKKGNVVLQQLRCVLVGTVLGALLCAFLMACVSFGIVKSQHISQGLIEPIVICMTALSSFFSGYTAVRLAKQNGLLLGAAAGLLLFLLLLLAGVLLVREAIGMAALTRLAVMVLSGAIGGFIAVSKKKKS